VKFRYLPAIVFVLACALLLVHVRRYYPFIADDALISLRYADRLLAGDGLTWTDGRPVEGYSNLLWILMVSVLGLFKIDLIVAARVLGVLSTFVVFAVVFRYSLRAGSGVLPATFGLGFLALSGPVAVWAIGGLEQPLVAALLATVLAAGLRLVDDDSPDRSLVLTCALSLGLMCWTRPDAPLFGAVIFAVVVMSHGVASTRVRALLPILLIPATFVVAQLVFRLSYYGEWLPNPAYIKLAPGAEVFDLGAAYVRDGLNAMGPLGYAGIGAVAAMAFRRETRRRGRLLLLVLLAWVAYVVFVGGDIFPGWRLLVPVYVTLAFALLEVFRALGGPIGQRRTLVAAAAIIVLGLIPFAVTQYRDPENRRAIEERWEWDGAVIGLVLKAAFGEREPLLACDSAGCLPYFSGLPSIDMLGLNDHHIARARPDPDALSEGAPAHQFGDGEYVLSRRPDLVSFCVPSGGMGACFRSGKEMQEDEAFFAHYRLVTVRGHVPHTFDGRLWIRFDSEKIGMKKTDDGYRVPAYFFGNVGETLPCQLDERSRLVMVMAPGQTATLALTGLDAERVATEVVASDPSRVHVAIEPTPKGIRLELRTTGTETVEVAEVIVRDR
jgi:hypothetical protein